MNRKKEMLMGTLTKLSGVPRHTIHYYVKKGLLHPPEKRKQTRAYYDDTHLKRLRDIQNIKRGCNFPIDFIKMQLDKSDKSKKDADSRPVSKNTAAVAKKKAPLHDEKKQKIIEAAIKLFSSKGYHRTNVKRITDLLGFSTGTFYNYFKGKRELFIQVVAEVVRIILAEVESADQKETDFFKRNMLLAEVLGTIYPKLSELLIQVRAEAISGDSWAGQSLKNAFNEVTRPFIQDIQRGIEQGLIRPIDPVLFTSSLIGMFDMLVFRNSLDNQYDLDQIISFATDLIFNGVRPDTDSFSLSFAHGS